MFVLGGGGGGIVASPQTVLLLGITGSWLNGMVGFARHGFGMAACCFGCLVVGGD